MRMCGGSCPRASPFKSSVILKVAPTARTRGCKKPSSQTWMLLAAMMRHVPSASLGLKARRLQGPSWRTLFNQRSRRSELRKLRLPSGGELQLRRLRGRFELRLQVQVRLPLPLNVASIHLLHSDFGSRRSVFCSLYRLHSHMNSCCISKLDEAAAIHQDLKSCLP